MEGPRWFSNAFGIFLALLAIAIASALVLNVTLAQNSPFSMALRSKLNADYTQEETDAALGPIRLSIIRETLKDLGFGSDEADVAALAYRSIMDDPVPTATALNFSGDDPFTPTIANVPASPQTPEPGGTHLPTKTLPGIQLTKTKTVTLAPKGTAAETLVPCFDEVKPNLSGGLLDPPPGALQSCLIDIRLSELQVRDASVSSGIEWVNVKYKIEGPDSRGYVYSGDLSPPDRGGWSGSAWDAVYSGMITVDFDQGYAFLWGGRRGLALSARETATPTPEIPTATYPSTSPAVTDTPVPPTPTHTPIPPPFMVKLWAGAQDNEGNVKYLFLGTYTMPAICE